MSICSDAGIGFVLLCVNIGKVSGRRRARWCDIFSWICHSFPRWFFKKTMNILHTESSMNWGGQEYRTLLEHSYLNENGHASWIMCHPKSKLYIKARELHAENIIGLNLSSRFCLYAYFYILVFCLKNRIDVINSHSSKDSLACYLCYRFGFPLVRSRQITSLMKSVKSYQARCTHVLATAGVIKELLVKAGVDADRVSVIGEGVDFNEYNAAIDCQPIVSEFNIKSSDRVIVNIGMIRKDKGQEYYIKAAAEVLKKQPDAKFFLVGESVAGDQLECELKDLVFQYNMSERFIFTGYRNDVNQFIKLAELVVVSSIGVEAQSRIVPQAFATGKTVVSTSVGGLTELVQNGVNGLVVPPGDFIAMADAIEALLNDENKRDKLAGNARQLAENSLSFNTMMDKTLSLYASLL